MDPEFNKGVFHGYLLKGDLTDAIGYLSLFPEKAELYQRYISVFEKEAYSVFTEDNYLNEILILYQKYYRDVFYLRMDKEEAEKAMQRRFALFFGLPDPDISFNDVEEHKIAEAFRAKAYHFLGGKTAGYWGPYIWKTTEEKTYDVELPAGRQSYQVNFVDGFISKGWLDFISFGEIGTGGWTDGDGIIHCVKASYDLEDESFTVSLLKHEAQHALDLAQYPDMSSGDLEYRAKLVELVYSNKRNLLLPFLQEADASNADNGHALAANRIAGGFIKRLDGNREKLHKLSIDDIQSIAKALLQRSNEEIKAKYSRTEPSP